MVVATDEVPVGWKITADFDGELVGVRTAVGGRSVAVVFDRNSVGEMMVDFDGEPVGERRVVEVDEEPI